MLDWKTVGPDSLPVEFLKLDHPELMLAFTTYHHVENEKTSPAMERCGHQSSQRRKIYQRVGLIATSPEGVSVVIHAGKSIVKARCVPPQQLLRGKTDNP